MDMHNLKYAQINFIMRLNMLKTYLLMFLVLSYLIMKSMNHINDCLYFQFKTEIFNIILYYCWSFNISFTKLSSIIMLSVVVMAMCTINWLNQSDESIEKYLLLYNLFKFNII